MSDTVDNIPSADIGRKTIERATLERAAQRVEQLIGNSTYTQAWRRAAQAIRNMKPD